MRKTTFVGLAVIIASCTSAEKAAEVSERSHAAQPQAIHDNVSAPADSLYNILARQGYGNANPSRIKVSVVTEHLVDVSKPENKTDYVAALIQTEEEDSAKHHKVTLAVFDASKNMKLISSTVPDLTDGLIFIDEHGERASGQGPRLSTGVIKLSDVGDVVAITARTSKQFVSGVYDDEDVWMYGLYKDEIVMIHLYSLKFNHRITGDNNYSKDTSSDTQLIIEESKTKGMFDITQKTIVDVGGTDGGKVTETMERYSFNGKEYIQN